MTIINIMLLAYILSLFLAIKRGRKRSNILCCGIFGISCADGKKPNIKNLIILGLYNRTRGVDSCGYYYNGNIVKGIDKEADFKDFIIKNKLKPGDLPYETVMCHTRKSSYGSHSEENAHPHAVGNLVQTHNGTIKNIWSLCTKHGISHTNIHVDSIGLAHIIHQDGFGVLNEYEGHAALTMVFVDDPESLYLYHGASKEKEDGPLFEERPLFYLQTSDGLYYSSLKESLAVINNTKNEVKTLPHNIVFKIQHGKIVDEVYKVDRKENNITKVYTGWAGRESDHYTPKTYNYQKNNISNTNSSIKSNSVTLFPNHINSVSTTRSSILKEAPPPEKDVNNVDRVFNRYGRYHRCGLVRQGDSNLWENGEILLNGEYLIDRDGKILNDEKESVRTSDTYYFVRGVLLRDKKAYEECLKRHKEWADLKYNTSFYLSKYSRYPITTYFDEGEMAAREHRNRWYLDLKPYEGEVTLKFTKRKYKISNGYLESITHEMPPGQQAFDLSLSDSDKQVNLDNPMIEIVLDYLPKPESKFDNIANIIYEWADKVITVDDVEEIPEFFYYFIEKHVAESCPIYDALDLYNEVVTIMEKLISEKTTLLELFKNSFEEDDYICGRTLEKLFVNDTPAEIYQMPNRFKSLAFKTIPRNVKDVTKHSVTETVELSNTVVSQTGDVCDLPDPKQQLEIIKASAEGVPDSKTLQKEKCLQKKIEFFIARFEKYADELQKLDTDLSQNTAFCIYKFIDKYKEIGKKIK